MPDRIPPKPRPWLPRQASADYINRSIFTLETWARKNNKTKRKIKHHMVGNEACYFVDDLDEFNKVGQTFNAGK